MSDELYMLSQMHTNHYSVQAYKQGGSGTVFNRLKSNVVQHFKQNLILYLIIGFAVITGVTTGLFTVGAMQESQKEDLAEYISFFFSNSLNESVNGIQVFLLSAWQHFQFFLLIWLSGMLLPGMPVTFILIGIRSFFIGFTISFIVGQYDLGGALFVLVCILPQSLLYVPCYMGLGVLALENAIKKFRTRKMKFTREENFKNFAAYTVKFVTIFLALILGSVFESFVMPLLVGLFKWVFS